MRKILPNIGTLVLILGLIGMATGCGGEKDFVGIGKKLFRFYCIDCHGETGMGNGYNAEFLGFEPRDLTDSEESEVADLTNDQIFAALHRDLKDPDEDAYIPEIVAQMPTFKFTLAEAEIWSIVAYVRTLHPNDAPKIVLTPEMKRKRPSFARIRNVEIPEDLMTDERIELGQEHFEITYGCITCHSVGGEGGRIGPPLDRAGFMSNADWLYRWIKNPQAIRPRTKMPNLGLTDEDAMAVVAYLKTLRAPRAPAAVAGDQPQP